MQEDTKAQWEQLAREVLSGMKEWQSQHPTATFAEIEEAIEEHVAKMRARMLEDVVQWRALEAGEGKQQMRCNACGGELEERGKHVRHLITQGNQPIVLKRSYGYCPTCRVGFFPLDEQLELRPKETFTPRLQEGMVRLATWMPFRQASEQLEFFMGTAVGATTIRETTEQAGEAQVQLQDQRAASLQASCPPSPPGPEVQLLSVDGAFVQLVGGEWKEVKTLALGSVGEPVEKDGEAVVHSSDLSYFSRMSEAKEFEQQALVEIQERGVEKAGVVCAVTDGAEWIQRFVDLHRSDAVRILDFAHAMEKVAEVGHTIDEQGLSLSCLEEIGEQKRAKRKKSRQRKEGAAPKKCCPSAQPRKTEPKKSRQTEAQRMAEEGQARLEAWLDWQAEELKTGDAAVVVQEIERLWLVMQAEGRAKAAEAIATRLNYLKERQSMITYATFREQGYPIGSGSVESANKVVVESRMKGSGMRWSEEHVDSMLALRNAACSNRWKQVWKQIRQQWVHQTQAQRASKSAQRLRERQAPAEQALPEPVLTHEEPSPKPISAGQNVEPGGAVRKLAGPASPTLEVSPPAASSSSGEVKPKAPSAGNQRPAPTHPWRRPFLRQRPAS